MSVVIVHANGPVARIMAGPRILAEWALDARQVRTPAREAATLRSLQRKL